MRCNQCRPLPEEVARAADLLGRRWALAILWASAEAGAVRFNEFKQALEGIPPRTLAARLAELEEAGVLERRVLDTRPPLDLADALARDLELAPYLRERLRILVSVQAVAELDHLLLPVGQLLDGRAERDLAQADDDLFLDVR